MVGDFCEVIIYVLASCFPLYKNPFVLPVPSSNKISYPFTLTFFCLEVAVTITLEVDLFVFIGGCGWVKPISLIVMWRGVSIFPLWKFPLTYSSEA